MERFARLVMRHRRIVSAIWLALFVGGLISVSPLGDRWSVDFSLPGQPGDVAEQRLIDEYGVSTFDSYIAVVTVPEGQTVVAVLAVWPWRLSSGGGQATPRCACGVRWANQSPVLRQ